MPGKTDIQHIEKKWLGHLQGHCKELFAKTHLPSHDHTHHTRVWGYFKQLQNEIPALSREETEAMIFAVFFHDTGMVINPGPEHGKISRAQCEEFFNVVANGI